MLFLTFCRAVPLVGSNVPYGLKPSIEQNMNVVFFAIVPLAIWEWDENSVMYIRFGHAGFGNWRFDAGPGKITRCRSYMCVYSCAYLVMLNVVLLAEMLVMAFTFSDLI